MQDYIIFIINNSFLLKMTQFYYFKSLILHEKLIYYMRSKRSINAKLDTLDCSYEGYRSCAFNPLVPLNEDLSREVLEQKAKQIFQWAKKKGALYYTFFAYPETEGVLQKQQTFLDLDYFFDSTLSNNGKETFSFRNLGKGQGDGSSFPSGGLRVTHKARAYTIWDPRSEVFLRMRNKVLYIPSMLVSHSGQALDDKTLFRKSEKMLQNYGLQLLSRLGIKASGFVMALGLEQEFFVMNKKAFNKRLDLRNTGRLMIGKIPPKNQQFSDHYYGKLPTIIQRAFQKAQKQLLEIGVPCKTRHKQVAVNQYQFCPIFQDVGKAIDHNMIMMQILKQRFNDFGLVAHFHEKPFIHHNGSGKHCNYSLNYVKEDGFLYNLFADSKESKDKTLFRLFILIQLLAIKRHSRLYFSSVGVCGNQLRLGGHEAPPRIISAFLGDTVSSIIDGSQPKERMNLKGKLPNITYDLLQEDTDRNRTSPYAYTGNKFQFRAVGSSQNVCFPIAVIAITMADAIKEVLERLDEGKTIEQVIELLREETQQIRFNGNGYSKEWVEEARKRGLYINQKFVENIENIKTAGQVFVDLGVAKSSQVNAKYENMKDLYKNTVIAEKDTMIHILGSEIIPRCYEQLKNFSNQHTSKVLSQYSESFVKIFESIIVRLKYIKQWQSTDDLHVLSRLREYLNETCEITNEILDYIPKKESWPQFEDFMEIYD